VSDAFYNLLWYAGYPAFFTSSRPTAINARVTRRDGAFILASNHQAPYDIPLLMRHCARRIDFVSIVEVFRNPLVAWFYGSMNAFPLDRSKPDSPTVRIILERLSRGRVIGMFPEGRFRKGAESVVHTGKIRSGIGRIANLSGAPVIPCVIVGSPKYSRFVSWLPVFGTRYGIAFGEPIDPALEAEEIEKRLVRAMQELYAQLAARGFDI
jgi:1-acyl-sn-glycerol-3-phosphate acyltransferase